MYVMYVAFFKCIFKQSDDIIKLFIYVVHCEYFGPMALVRTMGPFSMGPWDPIPALLAFRRGVMLRPWKAARPSPRLHGPCRALYGPCRIYSPLLNLPITFRNLLVPTPFRIYPPLQDLSTPS